MNRNHLKSVITAINHTMNGITIKRYSHNYWPFTRLVSLLKNPTPFDSGDPFTAGRTDQWWSECWSAPIGLGLSERIPLRYEAWLRGYVWPNGDEFQQALVKWRDTTSGSSAPSVFNFNCCSMRMCSTVQG